MGQTQRHTRRMLRLLRTKLWPLQPQPSKSPRVRATWLMPKPCSQRHQRQMHKRLRGPPKRQPRLRQVPEPPQTRGPMGRLQRTVLMPKKQRQTRPLRRRKPLLLQPRLLPPPPKPWPMRFNPTSIKLPPKPLKHPEMQPLPKSPPNARPPMMARLRILPLSWCGILRSRKPPVLKRMRAKRSRRRQVLRLRPIMR